MPCWLIDQNPRNCPQIFQHGSIYDNMSEVEEFEAWLQYVQLDLRDSNADLAKRMPTIKLADPCWSSWIFYVAQSLDLNGKRCGMARHACAAYKTSLPKSNLPWPIGLPLPRDSTCCRNWHWIWTHPKYHKNASRQQVLCITSASWLRILSTTVEGCWLVDTQHVNDGWLIDQKTIAMIDTSFMFLVKTGVHQRQPKMITLERKQGLQDSHFDTYSCKLSTGFERSIATSNLWRFHPRYFLIWFGMAHQIAGPIRKMDQSIYVKSCLTNTE